MARIRQIRDVILVRQQEDRTRSLTYKELEVQAIMASVHAAAGNAAGVRAASLFRFHQQEPEPASAAAVAKVFKPGPDGLLSETELAAEVERQRGLL